MTPVVLQPLGSRAVAVGIWVCSAAAASTGELRLVPFLLLLCWVAWLALWRPRVRIDADGVELVNVVRRVRVPYSDLREVETRWALTLHTSTGRYVAWAAPASPRRHSSAGPDLARQLDPTGRPDTIRSSTAPESGSGAAALAINGFWRADQQRTGGTSTQRWDRLGIAVAVILLTATCVSALV